MEGFALITQSVVALDQVQKRIDQVLRSFGRAQEVLEFVARPAGKMLRPTLVLLCFDLCGGIRFDQAINTAAGVELVHLASLIHDDVVDGGTLRRGKPTAERRFGTQVAVLAGDHLFAGAFHLFSFTEEKVTQLVTEIIQEMCNGEINQLLEPVSTEGEYWDYIHKKTARLIGACCRLGTILSDQEHVHGDDLQQFGESIGLAFQLTDDVLDYRGVDLTMGKEPGSDFKEGLWTLPIIRAYKRGLIPYHWQNLGFEVVKEILEEGGIFAETWNVAASHVQNAVQILEHFPNSAAKDELLHLCRVLLKRKA